MKLTDLSRLIAILIVPAAVCLLLPGALRANAAESLERRQQYFYSLAPRTTKDQVVNAVGQPDKKKGGKWYYRLRQGQVEVSFDGQVIADCDHVDPGDGERLFLYSVIRKSQPREIVRHDQLLARGEYRRAKPWGDDFIRSHGYPGRIYLLSRGFVVFEDLPLVRSGGAFEGRFAKATLHRDGTSHTLYRLFDHWKELRPSGVAEEALKRRAEWWERGEAHLKGQSLEKTLGREDGTWGSGMDYRLYYLPQGLLTVSVQSGRIASARFSKPGAE